MPASSLFLYYIFSEVQLFSGVNTGTVRHRHNVELTLYGHIKPLSNGQLYTNTVIGTLAVDGWVVTFGTARRGLGGAAARPDSSSLNKCNSPSITGQCTNFISFDVAL